jgi:hypothetical protein
MGSSSERWRIRPLELPRPWRDCASCASARAFVCSERFRVNAQKKALDVWLKYRCASCDDVWKFPLRKRVRDGQTYLLSKNDLTADRQNGGSSVL